MEENKDDSKYIEPTPMTGSLASVMLYILAMLIIVLMFVLFFNDASTFEEKLRYTSNITSLIMGCVAFGVLVGLGSVCSSLVKIVENTNKDTGTSSIEDPRKNKDGSYKSVFEEENKE